MRRAASLFAGAAAIVGSYMAVIFGLSPAQSFGTGTIATIAFPGLVTGLIATWLIAIEATNVRMTTQQVHELHVQLAHREVDLTRVESHDDLTGLYSRARFDETVGLELERALRLGRPFAILLFALDGFDGLREHTDVMRRGYVLAEIAALLESMLSINDTGSRYNDGCFGVLLPETDTAGALEVAAGIQIQLDHREFYGKGDVVGSTLSASQGIAVFPSPGITTISDLENAAERALLEAKQAGGATIRVFAPATAVSDREREALAS